MKTKSIISVTRVGILAVCVGIVILNQPAIYAQWTTVPNSTDIYKTTNAGNVGIGTSTPDLYAKVHVYNPPNAGVDIQSADTAGWSRLRLVTRTHTYGWFSGDSSQGDAPDKIGLYDYTVGTFRLMIDASGKLGIGTPNPALKLHLFSGSSGVASPLNSTQFAVENNDDAGVSIINPDNKIGRIAFGTPSGSDGPNSALIRWDYTNRNFDFATDQTGGYIRFLTGAFSERMRIDAGGNVGIGKTTATEALDVQGNIKASGTIFAKYQDVAEWVPSSEKLASGTVVILDSSKSNQVVASTVGYDTRVAGVISAQPGIALGEKSDNKVLVATTGRVKVKVDGTKSPIHIGDLLVTSDIPGVAMKSEPIEIGGRKMHMPGTLIGKALEPLEKGSGAVLVLLSLQ